MALPRTTEELFDLLEKEGPAARLPATMLLQGEDAFLMRALRDLLPRAGFEVQEADIKRGGPDTHNEELCLGGSLFTSRTFVWLKKAPALSQWKSEAKEVWRRMRARADGQDLVIALQVPADKRMHWSALEIESSFLFQVDPKSRGPWLRRMVAARKAELGARELSFLQSLEAPDLLTLENWIELWSLGGDVWAEKSLGWDPTKKTEVKTLSLNTSDNPAFAWVDAVLVADARKAVRLLTMLLDKGQEPLMLLALLSKSARILASVETQGKVLDDHPEFLVNKMRTLLRNPAFPRGRGQRLLKRCALLDTQLKSVSFDAEAALRQLGH